VTTRDRTNGERTGRLKTWAPRYWAPATIFLLGALSIALLIWIDEISRTQHSHFALADALMDLRIRVATSDSWFDKVVAGGAEGGVDKAWSDLREATRLAEVILNGGESENGVILPPLKQPELRRRAAEIKRLLSQFAMIARERYERPESAGIGSALEKRYDDILDELQLSAHSLETTVEESQAADYATSRRLIWSTFLAWPSIIVWATAGLLRRERRRRQVEEALQSARDGLEVRVAERTEELETLNDQLGQEVVEHEKAEEALRESERQLRTLAASLLTAQEVERSRISRGLHDGLGHSLILMKLRLGLIEKAFREDRPTAEADCKDLLQFTDEVIEDLRRLSHDLSPAILGDLGLSAALGWLVSNFSRTYQAYVVSSLVDVDHLFSPAAEIVIYRTIQEALTNVAKYAEAKCVSVIVERHQDQISFVVEDDGVGFDVKEAVLRDGSERGLGLATMDERARMLGGSLSVWSEKGEGTCVTLRISVPKKEELE
jgi:signal transduction histidine kinase